MKLTNEAKIGIMVVGVLVALFIITIKASDFSFREKGYELIVHFKNIDGVDKNAPVRLNGFEVGTVKDIKILYGDDPKMELTLLINEGVKIYQGTEAYVKNLGLFGEKYIGLTLGDAGKEYVSPGSVVIGDEAANLDKIMADGEVIATNLKEISAEVKERLKVNSENIDSILANLKVTSEHMSSLTTNLDERLQVNKGHIDSIMANMNSAVENFDEMSYDLKLNPWKLMYKERERRKEETK
ncbi:MAG: hypothetical protein A2Z88_06425 [Omnitrophica WOR_2 bacterium GWA2_47_8]|nr:MAG: hypothetical protein A2Z88_06425 [Omnitrophica WOR_2 bacterium GWA2_47_8]